MKKLLTLALVLGSCSTNKNEDTTKPGYAVISGSDGLKYHTGLLQTPDDLKNMGGSYVSLSAGCENLPEEFDLRTLGLVSEIRDQGSCGSCWSFSKTNSLESALLGQGIKLDLSEQEMVSCDKSQWGCDGGLLTDYKYQITHGQGLEKDFPYTSGKTGADGTCKTVASAAKGVSFQYVGTADRGPTEQELKCALYTYKTVPWITVGATNAWGSPPKSEKTPYTSCAKSQTNHAVGVVGWFKANGKTQFIMKNSWGKNWGDQGYMSLPLGCNNFGEEVAFIEVDHKAPPTPPSPPGPCSAPKVKLAAEVQIFSGTEVMLGVKSEAGVTYSWTEVGAVVGVESMLYVSPLKDTVYKLTGKNSCAVAESQVRVRIVQSVKGK